MYRVAMMVGRRIQAKSKILLQLAARVHFNSTGFVVIIDVPRFLAGSRRTEKIPGHRRIICLKP